MKKDSKNKIARVYAEALYEASEQGKVTDKVYKDILLLLDVFTQNNEFVKSFSNPIWGRDSKKSALKEIAEKININQDTLNCLSVIVDNDRFSEIDLILRAYVEIYYQKHNMLEVEITSAKALSVLQNNKISEILSQKLNKQIIPHFIVDPEILGGLKIKYGSVMIDDSVLGKLNRLEIMMKGGQ